MRQLATGGEPAPRDINASTAPWATCSAVRALYMSLFRTPPEDSTPCSLREALVRGLCACAAIRHCRTAEGYMM